ncbi:hypothetical protein JVU11DRAFT_10674 [Chiua virens]|nr:hypothetical protein JVU11DRAFT_10674 [Chiua virens]
MHSQFESQKTDSLFEKMGHQNSVCSTDSSFFEQPLGEATKPPCYRPISSLSIPSVHSPPKEDDTTFLFGRLSLILGRIIVEH